MAKKRYTVIPQNAFDALQVDAGVLLKNFDIEAASASIDNPGFTDADLICATTGGINPSCVPSYSDYAEDVDNAPINVLEFKHLDSWECKLSTTGLGTSPELIKLSLGAADIDGTNTSKIIPRRDLNTTDFTDIWWVGDKANGGFVAIQLKNALSTGGFSLQTTKNGKGTVTLEITGHVSISAQDEMPMVFYSVDPLPTFAVTFNTDGGTPVPATQNVNEGGKATRPATDPSKAHYDFTNWYNGVSVYDFDTAVTQDITLTAHYSELPTYTVTFDADGGTPAPEAQTVYQGDLVTKPEDPAKTDYTFDGWFNGATEWDFDTDTVSEAVTLTAHYTSI